MAQPEFDPTCGGHWAAAAPGRKAGGAPLRHAPSWRRAGGNSQNYPGVSVTLNQYLSQTCPENTFAMIQPSTSNISHINSIAPIANPEVHHAIATRPPHACISCVADPDLGATMQLLAYASAEQKQGWHEASRSYVEALLGSRGVTSALHLDERAGHIHCIGGVRHG